MREAERPTAADGRIRRRESRPRAAVLLAVALALPLVPSGARPLAAQGFVARATSSLRYVELQPVALDTVSRERVTEGADGRLTFEGRPVTCVPGLPCTFYRIQPEASAVAGTQDLSFTVWGLGVPGLSATGLLRARADLAGELTWPQSDDALDALLGYVELQRGAWRARAGRQQTLSGLGFSGFDGASARWARGRRLSFEAYAGRSLARGLSEPAHDALRAIEDFVPDRNAYLFGAFLQADLADAASIGARYQREIWSDRSGLVQERASLDLVSDALAPLGIDAALDWDVALGRIGKSHVTVRHPLGDEGGALEATFRRYLPYFELSTIWGAFSPVPYHEALAAARVSPLDGTSLRIVAGWRRYGDPERTDFLSALTDVGWRAEAAVAHASSDAWSADATYRIEWGAGAFLSAADARARWRARPGAELGMMATVFQQILEYRVGEGRVWGGGLTWSLELPWRARLDGGAAVYRHGPERRATETPWNQTRLWTSLSLPFGEDPGDAVAPSGPRLRR